MENLINLMYLIATLLFIFGIKFLSAPSTARKGNALSSVGMLLAIIATLMNKGLSFEWIAVGLLVGSIIGAISARVVAMTSMPEMVALFNGLGGLSSLLIGVVVFFKADLGSLTDLIAVSLFLSILVGGVTFSGSLIAWAKLSGKINKTIRFKGQQPFNIILILSSIILFIVFNFFVPFNNTFLIVVTILSLLIGIFAVIPIGGADMPVVISLLNSYSGVAGATTGFALGSNVLIVSGTLVGASGLILTNIMCKAMNRSLANVLFGGFSGKKASSDNKDKGEAKPISPEDAFYVLEAAKSVVIVPGYGMAVAQAQHVVRELAELLEQNGTQVSFGIHPVAGRMPGHMNVLLAEANVPYEQLKEMDVINQELAFTDLVIVIGANDVVNLDARDDENSEIYGMPIIEVDKAKNVFVLKRSMNTGYAGLDNPLFYKENTNMLFGDAKASISALVAEFKDVKE